MDHRRLDWFSLLALALVPVAAVVLGAGLWVTLRGGEARGGSLPTLSTSFHPPSPYDLGGLERTKPFRCGRTDTACTLAYLVGVTRTYGPRAALGLMQRFQQQHRVSLVVNDHALAHVVGRETARDYGSNFRSFNLCPITFNYGCQHGFFEYVLGRTDTPRQAAISICQSIGSDRMLTAGFSCYHGVGHGVMMAEAYNLPAALDVCNTLPKPKGQDGCWQGVFMENVNAGMQGRARPGVFSRRDPLAPCDRVADRYRHECFINQAGYLMHVSSLEIGRATRDCLAAPGRYKSVCMQSIGLMVTNPVWQAALSTEAGKRPFAVVAWDLCRRFPSAYRRDCVIAGVDNLANFDELDVRRSSAFCAVVAAQLASACAREIGVDLRARTVDPTRVRRACRRVPEARRAECLAGAGLPAKTGARPR